MKEQDQKETAASEQNKMGGLTDSEKSRKFKEMLRQHNKGLMNDQDVLKRSQFTEKLLKLLYAM